MNQLKYFTCWCLIILFLSSCQEEIVKVTLLPDSSSIIITPGRRVTLMRFNLYADTPNNSQLEQAKFIVKKNNQAKISNCFLIQRQKQMDRNISLPTTISEDGSLNIEIFLLLLKAQTDIHIDLTCQIEAGSNQAFEFQLTELVVKSYTGKYQLLIEGLPLASQTLHIK